MWFTVKQRFERNQVVRRSLARLFCSLICSVDGSVREEYFAVSSAYSLREHEISKKFTSFRNIRKISGPRMEPYGTSTPCSANLQSDHLFYVYIQLNGKILQKILLFVVSLGLLILCVTQQVTNDSACDQGSNYNSKCKPWIRSSNNHSSLCDPCKAQTCFHSMIPHD